MTLRDFIRANRTEIDAAIDRVLNYVPRSASCYHTGTRCPQDGTEHTHSEARRRNDDDRAEWIANDEGLYSWAQSEGVEV